MSDIFADKNFSPMLLTQTEPFDDENYIYELKLDGIRCLAYIDGITATLCNKRHKDVTALYPELSGISKCVTKKCVLDGELVCLDGEGKPDFFALQSRSLMSNPFKINLAARTNPVQYVAYDVVYYDGDDLTLLPQLQRKRLLERYVKQGQGLSISRYISTYGVDFFKLAARQGLEGVVAKKKNGLYYVGKRTDEWVKFKVMQEDDLIICGIVPSGDGGIKDLLLGEYENGKITPRGSVSLGISKQEQQVILRYAASQARSQPLFDAPSNVLWLEPRLVGTVRYMHKTEKGHLRQPVWKGLRPDKSPAECTAKGD